MARVGESDIPVGVERHALGNLPDRNVVTSGYHSTDAASMRAAMAREASGQKSPRHKRSLATIDNATGH